MKKSTAAGILALTLSLLLLSACGTQPSNPAEPGTPSTATDISSGEANRVDGNDDVVTSTDASAQTAYQILNAFPATSFTNEAIPDGYLDLILKAALNTADGSTSPCRFVVVKDPELRAQLCDANDLCEIVVVTAPADQGFAAGSAAQSMYLMAQALGLGSSKLSADAIRADAALQTELGIAAGHQAAAILIFGHTTETPNLQLPDVSEFTSYAS